MPVYSHDNRIVLTLDAGGTNFVFSAIQANSEITEPFCLPACPGDLAKCLDTLVRGFTHVRDRLSEPPVAISFAFPGPADYKNGIIGDLPNFPSFRGGVPLGPFLQEHFGMPVFINNDGNLFAYGEALAGALPALNEQLKAYGSSRIYRNLIGITFGTGFGCGIVIEQRLLMGDNYCGGDVWVFRNKLYPGTIAEESVSARAIVRVYNEIANTKDPSLTPEEVFAIAEGEKEGDKLAAITSFAQFGEVAGDAIAHLLTFADGIIVLGGGIIGAAKYIMPSLLKELNSSLTTFDGSTFPRLQMDVLDPDNADQFEELISDKDILLPVSGSDKTVSYNPYKKTAIMKTLLGTSRAVSLGAYSYALSMLDN